MFAARYGQIEILKYLIEQECDLQNYNSNYELMHTACMSKDMNVLKYLIEDVNLSINNSRKAKAPLEFLFPVEKEHDDVLLKKWKPVYEVFVPKEAW